MKALLKPALVLVLLIIGVISSVWLRSLLDLSEDFLMVLFILSTIFSILLPNLNQLKSFSIMKGELILQEVKDSEDAVKELARATVDLVEAANEGSRKLENFDYNRYQQAVKKINTLTSKA